MFLSRFAPAGCLVQLRRRTYAISRFANKPTGTARTRKPPQKRQVSTPHEKEVSEDISGLWHTVSRRPPASDPEEGLHKLLMGHKALVVERQIEMLNIFIGFEQCNKYIINNEASETVGYIAEEERGFLAAVSRQAFATHRPFKAVIMDAAGSPILWVRRPFAWINSRMYVQKLQDLHAYTPKGEPVLDTFGEVQQIWHPWRRRYDVFLREEPRRVLSLAHEAQPEPAPEPEPVPLTFRQFGKVDSGLLSWHFPLYDSAGREIAFVSRAFRGIGREIFTDTGRYTVGFTATEQHTEDGHVRGRALSRNLSLDERAVILALAVNVDFDYFSRHSGVGSGGFFHFSSWE